MKLLITGGAGFIGSNFIHYMCEKYPSYTLVNYDKLTYCGNLQNLTGVAHLPQYTFIEGDICDRARVDEVVKQHKIDTIVNFAAESHVDRSIQQADVFVQSNVLGTQVLLEVAKANDIHKFVQISTDEVYGTLGETGYFTETTPYAPNSPYSASKAAGDMLVRSYYSTYGMNVNITNCSNNYGPYQFPEKLIPLMITNALQGKKLPIYGDGKHVRDWLHVYDHCTAIDLVLHKGEPGEVYNVGGHNERHNIDIVTEIVDMLGVSPSLITYVDDRLGHDRRYAIDPKKICTTLGWEQRYTFETGLRETVRWYLDNRDWWEPLKARLAQQIG
ncbi:dTDP-glucose 4,6-dehydratase [Numidum massiliense]|uniref:dTDP-glucose 4,6-dehydratase n=1 Tax=Numidum massiliense TaxID=1522315 RepID=UPI0006D57335|nr:dTDP-glucose 4,6-dehydratase [Numidum massiliense]